MYGRYGPDRVMVIGVPDEIGDLEGDALIYFDSPLHTKYGERVRVKWREVEDLDGPAVERR
jgi:hypothetical protein